MKQKRVLKLERNFDIMLWGKSFNGFPGVSEYISGQGLGKHSRQQWAFGRTLYLRLT